MDRISGQMQEFCIRRVSSNGGEKDCLTCSRSLVHVVAKERRFNVLSCAIILVESAGLARRYAWAIKGLELARDAPSWLLRGC